MFLFMRFLFFYGVCFFSLSSGAIYNLKTNTGAKPQNVEKKYWLLVAQGCHSCTEVLKQLEAFCSGKKPTPSKIGFFVTGNSTSTMLKKLEKFKSDYEIFSGSPNEFYESYQITGSPSLRIKNKNKSVSGKDKILKFLKKDSNFCTTS